MSNDFVPRPDPEVSQATEDSSGKLESRSEPEQGTWRLVGIAGLLVALLIALWESLPVQPRQARGFLFAAVVVIVVLIALRVMFRSAWRTLRAQPDLLVPIGVVAGMSQLVALLSGLPLLSALFLPKWTANVFGLAIELSLGVILSVAIWTAYAAWQTDLLLNWLRRDARLSLAPWAPIRHGFWRALVALAIGVGVLLAATVLAIALGVVAFPLALLAMGVIGVGWNLCTAALLPIVLSSPGRLGEGVRNGFRLSWQLKSRWWRQLMAQLVLLGLFVFVAVRFTATTTGPSPMGTGMRTHTETNTNTKWSVNAFWVGGYEHDCRWYTKYCDALEAGPMPFISQGLGLLFLVVAVAMKITVIRGIVDHLPSKGGPVHKLHSDSRSWP